MSNIERPPLHFQLNDSLACFREFEATLFSKKSKSFNHLQWLRLESSEIRFANSWSDRDRSLRDYSLGNKPRSHPNTPSENLFSSIQFVEWAHRFHSVGKQKTEDLKRRWIKSLSVGKTEARWEDGRKHPRTNAKKRPAGRSPYGSRLADRLLVSSRSLPIPDRRAVSDASHGSALTSRQPPLSALNARDWLRLEVSWPRRVGCSPPGAELLPQFVQTPPDSRPGAFLFLRSNGRACKSCLIAATPPPPPPGCARRWARS